MGNASTNLGLPEIRLEIGFAEKGDMRMSLRRLKDGFFCIILVIITTIIFMNLQYIRIMGHSY